MILRLLKVVDVKTEEKNIKKVAATFIHDSFDEVSKAVLSDIRFLPDLLDFAENEKDNINDETCELLQPYLRYDANPVKNWSPWAHGPALDPDTAKAASGAAMGLCKFVGAMVMYHEAAKIVKLKMDFLKVQEAKLEKAMRELAAAEGELKIVLDDVAELDRQLQEALEK